MEYKAATSNENIFTNLEKREKQNFFNAKNNINNKLKKKMHNASDNKLWPHYYIKNKK